MNAPARSPLPLPMPAPEVLDREFLQLRAKVLELAASIDRLERSTGYSSTDTRLERLRQAIQLLLESGRTDRAEQLQLLFSRTYDPQWRQTLGVPPQP